MFNKKILLLLMLIAMTPNGVLGEVSHSTKNSDGPSAKAPSPPVTLPSDSAKKISPSVSVLLIQRAEDRGFFKHSEKRAIKDKTSSETKAPSTASSHSPILNHRATYTVTLQRNKDTDPEISDVRGTITIQIKEEGDKWSMNQETTLMIYDSENNAEQLISSIVSSESADGLQYWFKTSGLRNGQAEEVIRGEALMATKDGEGFAKFQVYPPNEHGYCPKDSECLEETDKSEQEPYEEPSTVRVALPRGTIFPLHHLVALMASVKEKQRVYSHSVFDGASENKKPVDVNTVLGYARPPGISIDHPELFSPKEVWPMQMAIYPQRARDLEPDHEVLQNVLAPLVIRDMQIDYGPFVIKAELSKIEIFN